MRDKVKTDDRIQRNPVIKTFTPRFVPEYLLPELSNMWHLSRVVNVGRHDRALWTAAEFAKAYPDLNLTSTGVYKDLTDMLEFGGW